MTVQQNCGKDILQERVKIIRCGVISEVLLVSFDKPFPCFSTFRLCLYLSHSVVDWLRTHFFIRFNVCWQLLFGRRAPKKTKYMIMLGTIETRKRLNDMQIVRRYPFLPAVIWTQTWSSIFGPTWRLILDWPIVSNEHFRCTLYKVAI